MNSYAIADLILTLISVGIRVDALRDDLNDMRASGKTDEEVSQFLRTKAAEALKAAQDAVRE